MTTTDTDLIAYLEAQRRRRTIILGWVLAIGITVAGVAFFATRPSKDDIRNDRTNEVVACMTEGKCD